MYLLVSFVVAACSKYIGRAHREVINALIRYN